MLSWMFPAWSQPTPECQVASASTQILDDPLKHDALTHLRDLVVPTYRDSWPLPLRPYDTVYRAMEASFPVTESSTDGTHNRKLIDSFRERMRCQLEQHSAWLGFFLCIWGVTPVVSEAQSEQVLSTFPSNSSYQWTCLQRHFGVTSPSGCMTSLMYANMREDDRLEYTVTLGMPEPHQTTEYWNTKLLVGMEERRAIAFLEAGDTEAACTALQSANTLLKTALRYFFTSLVDGNLSKHVWLAYVQGYQGWTLGGIDGISGGQKALHLPDAQRTWLNFLRDYDIRAVAKARGEEAAAVTEELESLVKQLRVSTP
ncbi:hypothetical protein C8R46DRAFT_1082904 [Mycena filopes]|nr:hypothetical protein C8R46DRAFT_1082904 [Mycena filopes]